MHTLLSEIIPHHTTHFIHNDMPIITNLSDQNYIGALSLGASRPINNCITTKISATEQHTVGMGVRRKEERTNIIFLLLELVLCPGTACEVVSLHNISIAQEVSQVSEHSELGIIDTKILFTRNHTLC